jgi:hypothetical protein
MLEKESDGHRRDSSRQCGLDSDSNDTRSPNRSARLSSDIGQLRHKKKSGARRRAKVLTLRR